MYNYWKKTKDLLIERKQFNKTQSSQFNDVVNYSLGTSFNPLGKDRKLINPTYEFNYNITEWLDNNADKINDAHDAYETYWPLYLYYTHLNDDNNAEKFLDLAYKAVEAGIWGSTGIWGSSEEGIEGFHLSPNKDTDPRYFYCRDIIKAYDKNNSLR